MIMMEFIAGFVIAILILMLIAGLRKDNDEEN